MPDPPRQAGPQTRFEVYFLISDVLLCLVFLRVMFFCVFKDYTIFYDVLLSLCLAMRLYPLLVF